MSAKATGADTSSSGAARNREHQQGKQDREYTTAQKAAVDRVRKCKPTAYYEILNIKVEADDGEIKKAYKKLALVMHPDKNGAPGADEAFKLIAKAFQVLSDPQKRAIFDKTGGDPESRNFGGSSAAGGASPFAGFQARPGRPQFTDEISPEELFNMFFGGVGAFGGGGGGTFFDLGGGGPGIRIHHFGGQNARRRPNANAEAGPDADNSITSTIIRLLPLILIFAFSLMSSILSGFGTTETPSPYQGPRFKFRENPPYVQKRHTPRYKVPFYVIPTEIEKIPADKLNKVLVGMDRYAEVTYVNHLREKCTNEQDKRQEKIQQSQGWFFVDQKKFDEAMKEKMKSCDRLRDLGLTGNR